MSRPTKLTPEVAKAILDAVKAGTPPLHAARALGVHERTFQRWVARGDDPDAPSRIRRFCRDLRGAQSTAIRRLVICISKRAPKSLFASMWLLERLDRHNFGREAPPPDPTERPFVRHTVVIEEMPVDEDGKPVTPIVDTAWPPLYPPVRR